MLARRHLTSHPLALLASPPLARLALIALAALAAPAPLARAAAPAALINPNYAFPLPGDYVSPVNAASAGLALSDRWLGTNSFENPAARLAKGIELTPVFQRVSRQDISSQNRDFEQVTGYPDVLGARLALPAGGFGITLYAWQPVLRLEEFQFSAGPLANPAALRLLTSQREVRAGAAVSRGFGAIRMGVAGEWTRRDDAYETHEQSGDPLAGDRRIELAGDGFGGSVGIAWEKDPDRPWGSWFGAGIHYGSELALSGSYSGVNDVPGGVATDTTYALDVTREAEWSGGVSGKMAIAPATYFVAGLSFRSGAEWKEFGFGTSTGASWSVGLDWKDPELTWGARFGFGQEKSPGAMEEKAGLIGVGFTWVLGEDIVLDAGLLHRNLANGDAPRSSDDRVTVSARVAL
jgi:hypothetical protein